MTFGRKMSIPSTLAAAVTTDHRQAFVALLDRFAAAGCGVDHLPEFQGMTLLHFSVLQKRTWAVEELLRRGADPNRKTAVGRTALDIALDPESPAPPEIAEMLYARGADVAGGFRSTLKNRARDMKSRGYFTLKGKP